MFFAIEQCDLILILRDRDDQPEREASIRAGVQAFVERFGGKLQVCIGVPNIEREAWVLSGFSPKSEIEDARLKAVTLELGFDPTTHSERLTSGKDDQAQKSPKRVLAVLTEQSRLRESSCWEDTSLETLRARGKWNGLEQFLAEAEAISRAVFERRDPH